MQTNNSNTCVCVSVCALVSVNAQHMCVAISIRVQNIPFCKIHKTAQSDDRFLGIHNKLNREFQLRFRTVYCWMHARCNYVYNIYVCSHFFDAMIFIVDFTFSHQAIGLVKWISSKTLLIFRLHMFRFAVLSAHKCFQLYAKRPR